MNICANCAHVRHVIKNPNAPEVWYNWFCGKAPRVPATDPVSGAKGYAGKNDLGTSYVTEDPYEYARNINPDGRCRMYTRRIEFVVALDQQGE